MAIVSRRNLLLGAAGVGVLGVAGYGAARVFVPWHKAKGSIFNVDGIAIRGADPVAYFTEKTSVMGDERNAYDWAGATWHFASMENREMFKADPEAYAPQYGGYCAWAVGAKGLLYSIQPHIWSVVDNKLYLNFDDVVHNTWVKDIPGFIEKADARWPELRDQMVYS